MEPSSPIGRMQSGFAASFVTPSPKKTDGKADQAVDNKPYIDKRKPLSTTAAKGDSNNGLSQKKTFACLSRVNAEYNYLQQSTLNTIIAKQKCNDQIWMNGKEIFKVDGLSVNTEFFD